MPLWGNEVLLSELAIGLQIHAVGHPTRVAVRIVMDTLPRNQV